MNCPTCSDLQEPLRHSHVETGSGYHILTCLNGHFFRATPESIAKHDTRRVESYPADDLMMLANDVRRVYPTISHVTIARALPTVREFIADTEAKTILPGPG